MVFWGGPLCSGIHNVYVCVCMLFPPKKTPTLYLFGQTGSPSAGDRKRVEEGTVWSLTAGLYLRFKK